MNQRTKIISAAAAVVLGVSAVGGIAFAEHQFEPSTATTALNQVLAASPTATPPDALPPVATPPSASGSATPAIRAERQQRRDDFLNILAQNLNIGRPALNTAMQSAFDQEIDKAVAANQITAQQAAKLKARVGKDKLPLGVQLGGEKAGQPGQPGQPGS